MLYTWLAMKKSNESIEHIEDTSHTSPSKGSKSFRASDLQGNMELLRAHVRQLRDAMRWLCLAYS